MPAASADVILHLHASASAEPADAEALTAVRAAKRGDRAAFAHLHAQFAPMVHGIMLARVPVDEASDLVQETFLHALERLRLLRDDAAFGPWLATMARNLAIEFHRWRRLRLCEELGDRVSPSRETVGDATMERAHRLLDVIRTLPDAYAETLVLRLVEGLTGPQIAACTGLTHGSVRVNLTRGMSMLRERLKQMNVFLEDSP